MKRFALRSLLLLVVATALPFAFLANHLKASREQEFLATQVVSAGGRAKVEYAGPAWLPEMGGQKHFARVVEIMLTGSNEADHAIVTLSTVKHLRALRLANVVITERGRQAIARNRRLKALWVPRTGLDDSSLDVFSRIEELNILDLSGNAITDTGLRLVARLDGLTSLSLADTQVSDRGLKLIADLNLRWLDCSGTDISNDGIAFLAGMSELRTLDLSDTNVTDKGLPALAHLRNLRDLRLPRQKVPDWASTEFRETLFSEFAMTDFRDQVTSEGVDALREVLPSTKIERR